MTMMKFLLVLKLGLQNNSARFCCWLWYVHTNKTLMWSGGILTRKYRLTICALRAGWRESVGLRPLPQRCECAFKHSPMGHVVLPCCSLWAFTVLMMSFYLFRILVVKSILSEYAESKSRSKTSFPRSEKKSLGKGVWYCTQKWD